MKKKEVLLRHKIFIGFGRHVVKPFLYSHYNIKSPSFVFNKKTQYLFLCNHALPYDPIMIDILTKMHIYYVSTEQILNLGLASFFLKRYVNLIPISKGVADTTTIKKLLRIKNEGGNIGIFPEGNTEFVGKTNWINPAIVKLIKMLSLPLVIINSFGLSFCNSRWMVEKKKGPCGYFIRSIVPFTDIKDLSESELYDFIKEKLQSNQHSLQDRLRYRYIGKDRALGLNRLLFVCPKCHSPFTTTSNENYLLCSNCNNQFLYDEYGYLVIDGKQHSLDHLYDIEKNTYLNYLSQLSSNILLFSEKANLMKTTRLRKKNIGIVFINVFTEGFDLLVNDKCQFLKYGSFKMALQGKRQIIIYTSDKLSLLIRFSENISILKFLITYQYYTFKIFQESHKEIKDLHYGL